MHRDGPKTPKDGFDFEAWLEEHKGFAKDGVPKWIDAVNQKYGKFGTKFACVG